MRKITIARFAQEMDALRPVWELLVAGRLNTIFQGFEWNQFAARFFSAEQPPFVVMAESDSGAAIIPACIDRKKGTVTLLGEELFDYRDFLHAGDHAVLEAAWQTVLTFATEQNLGFGFHSFRAETGTCGWLNFPLAPFTSAPCAYARKEQRAHPHLEVNFRRLSRAGVTRHSYDGRNAALLQQVYSLKSAEADSLFRDSRRIQMLLAMGHCADKRCEVFTLEAGARLVASLVTFRDNNWRRFYTTYFDRTWAKYSPGSTLLNIVMQESLSSGLDCDLMTGDQPYKRRVADHEVRLYRVSVSAKELSETRANTVAA